MSDIVVQVRGLTRAFGKKQVLDGVSMDLRAGSVTGFVGSNGAGKTTTLRAMLGLLPSEGQTLFLGRPLLAWKAPSRVVGAAFGGVGGHPKHRVRDHLRMVAAGAGVPDARVDEVLERVGMREAATARLASLSLGMSQRVGLAQALLGSPRVLILDEPANGLDPHAIRWLRDFLRTLADAGTAVLVSSHLLAEMQQMADRVAVLSQGRIVSEASMSDLLARADSQAVVQVQLAPDDVRKLAALTSRHDIRLRQTGPDTADITGVNRERLARLCLGDGIPLFLLTETRPTLEDFYLTIAREEFKIA
ncbi:ATP-binding cassette domain-containing protein [Streptomyces sp. L2]|uniref:ABC transporter ATP-binding protein n=1 Tax=Streptomyces sp. L2 TaxID=2162665 RepID=UPI001013166B|nr:ATP-binding cassette domain-containing protein [Streptomyces sp. L2]